MRKWWDYKFNLKGALAGSVVSVFSIFIFEDRWELNKYTSIWYIFHTGARCGLSLRNLGFSALAHFLLATFMTREQIYIPHTSILSHTYWCHYSFRPLQTNLHCTILSLQADNSLKGSYKVFYLTVKRVNNFFKKYSFPFHLHVQNCSWP